MPPSCSIHAGDGLDRESSISSISSFLNVKLKQSVNELKRSLNDEDLETQREIKKITEESKAFSLFKFAGNSLQYELNIQILDHLNVASKKLVVGGLDELQEEIDSAIQKIQGETRLFILQTKVRRIGLL